VNLDLLRYRSLKLRTVELVTSFTKEAYGKSYPCNFEKSKVIWIRCFPLFT